MAGGACAGQKNFSEHQVSVLAAGSAFYLMFGLVPALAALISIYGLISDPSQVEAQFQAMSGSLPSDVRNLVQSQMTDIAKRQTTASFAAGISILIALWSASAGVKTLMASLNVIYGEREKRGFIKLSLVGLALTLGAIALGLTAVGLIVALPAVLAHVGLGDTAAAIASALRWPLLVLVAIVGLAVLYRYGPSREDPQWRWVSAGAIVATALWVGGSALFSFYATHFGSYNQTYGSLSAVIVLMTWLYLSALVGLSGAEINAESEHQTAKDTTSGRPEQIGHRGAYVADDIEQKE